MIPVPRQARAGSPVGKHADATSQRAPSCSLTCTRPSPRVLVFQLCGELDTSGADSVGRLLDEQLSRPLCRVVVDVGALTQVSGDGIKLLVGLHRRARIQGFALLLVGLANRAAERPLRLAGALPLFTTRPTLEHALAGVTARG